MGIRLSLSLWALMVIGIPASYGDELFPLADAVESHPRGGLPNFFQKMESGKDVRIAYLGGSITEAQGWRPLTLKWFQQHYPQSKVIEINAAISGTGSDFGAFRLEREVLQHNPDLLFVEFAVNDSGKDPQRIIQSMEGIVRQTWQHNPRTDICFVYTVSEKDIEPLQGGKFQLAASAMERVAGHYEIPSVHLGLDVVKQLSEGRLIFKGEQPKTEAEKAALKDRIVFSPDGTHPYAETGHPLYLEAIVRSLPGLKPVGEPQAHALPSPLDSGNWENAQLVPFASIGHTGNWRVVEANSKPGRAAPGRTVQVAGHPGDAVTFRFRGTGFGIYSLKGPDVGNLSITVDGGAPLVITLFDSLCVEDRFRIRPWIYPRSLAEGDHSVKIEILPNLPDKAGILKKPITAKQFEERNFYLSDVLVLGNIKN